MNERLAASAARNNAQWCDVICRLHGIAGTFGDDAWTSAIRTPTHYPDAVTLRRAIDAAGVVDRIDASAGSSVKDSFAELDLAPWGFETLFEAPWIHHVAEAIHGAAGGPEWDPVRDDATLAAWEDSRGQADAEHRPFPPGPLARPGLLVLAARERGDIVAGAVLFASAGVVSLANLFAVNVDLTDAFSGAAAAAARLHPGKPLVGYEAGADLDAAEMAGFERIGRLAVWIKN